jgi:hypothetical protein
MSKPKDLHISGGVFFALIMEAVKPRQTSRNHTKGHEDVASTTKVLEALFNIVNKDFVAPKSINKKDTWRAISNKFKSCTQSTGADLIIYDTAVISAFKARTYSDLLQDMSDFVYAFIDTDNEMEKHKLLIARLVVLIDLDNNVLPDDRFAFNGVTLEKAKIKDYSEFILAEFLLAVWHYIVCKNIVNSSGKLTYNTWWPSQGQNEINASGDKKRGGSERPYRGPIQERSETYITVNIGERAKLNENNIIFNNTQNISMKNMASIESDNEERQVSNADADLSNDYYSPRIVMNQYGSNSIQIPTISGGSNTFNLGGNPSRIAETQNCILTDSMIDIFRKAIVDYEIVRFMKIDQTVSFSIELTVSIDGFIEHIENEIVQAFIHSQRSFTYKKIREFKKAIDNYCDYLGNHMDTNNGFDGRLTPQFRYENKRSFIDFKEETERQRKLIDKIYGEILD